MVDVPGDSSTTSRISVGGSVTGSLELKGDHDWYAINLAAGQQIEILMTAAGGSPMEDPYLYLRDASGKILVDNDDGGEGRNARIGFQAPTTGTYYIDASAWEPDEPSPGYTGTGTYQLSVKTYVPPVAWTNDQIAYQLTTGYWEGSSHHFNVTQGGTITVNLTALNSEAQSLARNALNLWSDIIGISFREVGSGAQINFDDSGDTAETSAQWAGGTISSADINIAERWAVGSGSGLNSYRFQTYLHEIGHALGLGHAGNYNVEATYPFDASFSNDGWPITVMSYFAQEESTFYGDQGFNNAYVLTPMVADIIAIGSLYGLSKTTRTGDTVYGLANAAYGTFADRAIYNAAVNWDASITIYDSGGTDTLNYSGFSENQRIDLNPETFSNVAGLTGNLGIARGVTIENAIGGSGADGLIGNSADNILIGNAGADTLEGNAGNDTLTGGSFRDTLSGGAGSDTFLDTRANLNGDTILDFSAADRIVFTDATLSTFTYSLSGTVLTFTGGSLTFGSAISGTLNATAWAGGGVELRLSGPAPDSGGSGNDTLTGTAGADALYGFGGDDKLIGGRGADILDGGDGNDILSADREMGFDNFLEVDELYGGAGNDFLFAGFGDIVDGGDGFDTLSLSYVGASAGINGDTAILHQGIPLVPGGGTLHSIERIADLALTQFNDRMVIGDQTDSAGVRGWDGDDYLIGQLAPLEMYGGNGNDILVGSTADDKIYGDAGNDTLMGYLGRDQLWGGSGNDRFVMTHMSANATIMDFEHGVDQLDVTGFDANTAVAGDQAFTFVGSANFSGKAGELRIAGSASAGYEVHGDINGDGHTDFIIGLGSVGNLTASDFLL